MFFLRNRPNRATMNTGDVKMTNDEVHQRIEEIILEAGEEIIPDLISYALQLKTQHILPTQRVLHQ